MENHPNPPTKPHVLVLPYPAQGHINPMLQFAKRLLSKGIKATLVTTVYRSKSLHIDSTSPIPLQTISDGYDHSGLQESDPPEAYFHNLRTKGSLTLANLINRLGDVTCLVYDGLFPWALDVAKNQFGIKAAVFLTQSCAVNLIYYNVYKGVIELPLLSGGSVCVPGLESVRFQPWETPSFVYESESTPKPVQDFLFGQFSNVDKADWMLYNSFYMLEQQAVDWMRKLWKVGTIGPNLPYINSNQKHDKSYTINLYKPTTTSYTTWLNNKPKNSVVYVSFGSIMDAKPEQIEELAHGLKQTKFHFLWVVRDSEVTKLPNNFIQETASQGLVVNWCSQLEVLAHESVGCFVTHCGLNSVLEALSVGVVMVCMPQGYDQPTNAKYVEDVWGVGVRGLGDEEGVVGRDVVERCVKEVMVSEKGVRMKENALKWRDLAREAVDEGGSSSRNVDEFVAMLYSC